MADDNTNMLAERCRDRAETAPHSRPAHAGSDGARVHARFLDARRAATGRHPPQPVPQVMMQSTGLEAVYLQNRDRLLRLLAARGAGDAAEDLVQELWLRVSSRADGPVGNPLAYLCRAADLLMIDRYRSRRQSELRDQAWEALRQNAHAGSAPAQEREVAARQATERVAQVLRELGPRKETIFRRVRIEGQPQQQVADEFGISISTVESDLRQAARALSLVKEEFR